SSHRREGLAPRCRLFATWGGSTFQGLGCSPIKAVRELGSERRETVRSISGAGVRALRGPFPNYHYEDVWPEDVIYKGYGGVDCVEAGGPPVGAGCGGYVVGETVKLLKELNAFYEYDIILFDVLGDVVCGGFVAPLNYADYCIIITGNGFDALFAANPSLVGNRTSKRDLINKYVEACPMPVLEVLPLIEDIRVSRVKGKTLFEMVESQPSLNYVCEFYLNIADQILSQPEGIVPREVPDRELFSLLSDFYLNPIEKRELNQENLLDFTII
ncbi:hypothetical protein CY35_20G004100, partial [Sphagnum magellanicum]